MGNSLLDYSTSSRSFLILKAIGGLFYFVNCCFVFKDSQRLPSLRPILNSYMLLPS